MLAYLQGLSLGLAYVAPIGVQNLFVINAGLSQPRAAAYRTALIVIFFDVTLALAGFFGIGALIEHSELIRKGVLLAGSLVVMYMGLRLMLSREVAGPSINVNIPLMKTIGMACVVTWFNPQAIIDDIKQGIGKTDGKYVEICDRKEAIRYAIEHGQPGDVIVLAGKGHEDYQEIEGVKHPMDERILIKEVLEELGK
mgnify:CR=1 FL=1